MTSSRPYLIRAMYQWVIDNGMTPHLLVNASVENCLVPVDHIQDDKIVLNIAPMAIGGLVLGDDDVSFSARFNGVSESIYVPIKAVEAIYARENGQGMMFSDDDEALPDMDEEVDELVMKKSSEAEPKKSKPTLHLVK
ncbi:MAG: ClpXP protease specificity-enhancing factor [Gammaproteobacteria bacterium]|nr:ClpXP protease specificity-enhancing factor [Gammaproteobacteria bacterium]MCK5262063.1 ClpXP protease specificity-enhancing factor [Gammaproteobacteria bacterium]